MRVGLIAYGLDRPLTGVGRATVELARALAATGAVELTLLAAGRAPPLAGAGLPEAPLAGCRLLPGLLTLGNLAVPAAARRLGLQIVHDPAGFAPVALGAGGARVVLTLHDLFALSHPGFSTPLDTAVQRAWLPRTVGRAARVISSSAHSRGELARHLGLDPARVAVVPLGVDARFRPPAPAAVAELRARYGLPARYLLFVGGAQPRKNLAGLLAALAPLWRAGAAPPLVVAGSMARPSAELARALALPGCAGRVLALGHLPDADLPALYGGAALLAFPSLYEGFGLPVLEAMACGTPVLAGGGSSLPEVAGDAALLVDPTDAAALRAALAELLARPALCSALRARGLARAAAFTWASTAAATLRVYEEALAGHHH